MVYIGEIIKHNRENFFQYKNIELAAYLAVTSPEELKNQDFDLSPEEQIALQGYKGEPVDTNRIVSTISRPGVKGIDATSNIYKFAGLYLGAKKELKKKLEEKYLQGDLTHKYFLTKIEQGLKSTLEDSLTTFYSNNSNNSNPFAILIKQVYGIEGYSEGELDNALFDICKRDLDVKTQILLEDVEKSLIKIKYVSKTAEQVVRDALRNFPTAVQKIIKDRRKNHQEFNINDEYDVQDILYVILKSIFPNLKDEDPIAKVGGTSTKVDLILREQEILIEVKMIKAKDQDEKKFIQELKIDLESYHECKWLKKLFCVVYDPYNKTKDPANFHDLNGNRAKGAHIFDVEVILS